MMLPNDAGFGAWSVAAALVLGSLLVRLIFSSIRKNLNLPPGPRGLPIIGCLHLLGKRPHEDLAKMAQTYGPVMSFRFGQKLAVIASTPAAAEEFLKTQGHNFAHRPTGKVAELILPADISMGPETSTTIHLKKTLHMQLSTSKQITSSQRMRNEEIDHILRVIPQDGTAVAPVKTYIEVVITNILSRMVLKKPMAVIGEGGIGDDQGLLELKQMKIFREITTELHQCIVHKDVGDFIPVLKRFDFGGMTKRLQNLKKKMDAFMSEIVSEHLVQRLSGSSFERSMVDVLLDQMEDTASKVNITDQNVHNVLWDALGAGTSTSIEAIEWAMAECIHNPDVMKKAQDELDAVVGRARRVEDADIPNLKYLQAIVKETLRLHTVPLLLPRENHTACKVSGYDIPAGTMLMVNAWAFHRDPTTFEHPEEFMPERFVDGKNAVIDVQGNHFQLLPFGAGRRACPGISLALAMVHIHTATLLQCYDWVAPNLDMSEAEGMVPYLSKPLSAIPKARLPFLH